VCAMSHRNENRVGSAPIRPIEIAAALALLAMFSLTTGYSYPAITFNMEARGYSAGLIEAQAACAGLGILTSAALMPLLAQRFGTWRLAFVGLYGTVAAIISFGLTENLALWFLLRFVLGAMVSILFVVSEIWINQLTPDALRGRVIGVYAAANAGMFAVGPLLVPVIGYSGLSAFGVTAATVAVMGLSLIRLLSFARPLEPAPFVASLQVVAAIPVLLFAVIAFGFFDGTTLALWVVYAFHHGSGEASAALSLSAMIMGSVVLQFPIGWLADRMSRRRLLAILAAIVFCGAVFSLFLDDPALIPDSIHTATDGDHGRIETRTSVVSTDIAWLQERHQWPGLAAIGKVMRVREVNRKTTTETAYYSERATFRRTLP
jgi:MFS family permease